MSNQYLTRPAHGDVNTLSGGDLEGPFLPRLMPIRPSDKRPYSVSEGGFLWKSLGPTDGAMIERWASRFRSCGWAVRTGLLAGLAQSALTVVDVDDLDLAPDWTHDLDLFPWRVRTPRGGVHLYSWAGEPLRSGPLDYGDVKSTGGLVVGWQSDRSYRPEPGFGEGQLPLLPASVLADLIRTEPPPVAVEPVGTPSRPSTDRPQRLKAASYAVEGIFACRTPERWPIRPPAAFQAGRDADLRGDTARLTGLGTLAQCRARRSLARRRGGQASVQRHRVLRIMGDQHGRLQGAPASTRPAERSGAASTHQRQRREHCRHA